MGSCLSKPAVVTNDNITPYRDFTQDITLAATNRGHLQPFLWKNTHFVICLWSQHKSQTLQPIILDIVTLGGNKVHMQGGCVKRRHFRHIAKYLGPAMRVENERDYLNGMIYEWIVGENIVGYIQFVDMLPYTAHEYAISFEDMVERYVYRACMYENMM